MAASEMNKYGLEKAENLFLSTLERLSFGNEDYFSLGYIKKKFIDKLIESGEDLRIAIRIARNNYLVELIERNYSEINVVKLHNPQKIINGYRIKEISKV